VFLPRSEYCIFNFLKGPCALYTVSLSLLIAILTLFLLFPSRAVPTLIDTRIGDYLRFFYFGRKDFDYEDGVINSEEDVNI